MCTILHANGLRCISSDVVLLTSEGFRLETPPCTFLRDHIERVETTFVACFCHWRQEIYTDIGSFPSLRLFPAMSHR